MKNIIVIALAVVLIHLLSGCAASSYVPQVKQKDLPSLNLPFKIQGVEINDSRKNQSAEDIKLPLISKPNLLIKHVPALTLNHKQLIENVVRDNTIISGTPVKAVVNFLEGYKEFSSTWSSEKERGFVEITIILVNQETGSPITECNSSGELFIQSVDATNEKMEEIYRLTLKNVIYNCLKSMSSQEKK